MNRCGTVLGYRDHIHAGTEKCTPCRRAHADARADYRRRRYLRHAPLSVDATGTRRRIQALAAIGWSLSEQSQRLGMDRSAVHAMSVRTWVWPETAAKVAALYDELSMIPGPSTSAAKRAKAKSWAVPLAWDDDTIDDPNARPARGWTLPSSGLDEVAVQRAMRGERVRLRPVERAEAVARLTARGLSAAEIADVLGVDKRSVTRLRGVA